MEKILFFHGTGLNSNPERHLLTSSFKEAGLDLIGWDEPSTLRPSGNQFIKENAYENYLKSAEDFFLEQYKGQPITIWGHCFGCYPVNHLVNKHPEKIKAVFIIAPVFCLFESDLKIFSFAAKDYLEHEDNRAFEMQKIIYQFTGMFDNNAENGWKTAISNPRHFTHYWLDNQNMHKYFPFYVNEYSVDPESFFNVRKSWHEIPPKLSTIPTTIIYGKYDKVISVEDEIAILPKYYENLNVIEMQESAHYPHIDETNRFIGIIKEAIK